MRSSKVKEFPIQFRQCGHRAGNIAAEEEFTVDDPIVEVVTPRLDLHSGS